MTGRLRGFDSQRLDALMARFPTLRVAVLGDFFLDKYIEVDPGLAEPSLETGKTAHQVVGVRHAPGAAGTVVNNLVTLMSLQPAASEDAAAHPPALRAIGFTGDDGAGYELRQDLAASGVDIGALGFDTAPGRRTPVYLKPKDAGMAGLEAEHSRYDLKNRVPTGKLLERNLVESVTGLFDTIDVLVAMDQVEDEACGVFTPALYELLGRLVAGRSGPVAWADSRRRIRRFSGFIRKINQFELLDIRDPEPGAVLPDASIAAAMTAMERDSGAPVFVTAGGRGVWVMHASGPLIVPAVRYDGPVDPTGAGDSFTAGAVLSLAAGASPLEAALVGNLAASVTVRKLGTTGTASPEELRAALALWKGQNR
jgi:sugar/nucleoside kinase (ribokinase family)